MLHNYWQVIGVLIYVIFPHFSEVLQSSLVMPNLKCQLFMYLTCKNDFLLACLSQNVSYFTLAYTPSL